MVNWDHLNNMTDLNISQEIQIYTNPDNLTLELVNKANETTGGWWGLGILTMFFISTMYMLVRTDGLFRLDGLRAALFSAGLTLVMGVLLLTLAIITSYRHVVWYGIVFVLCLIMVFFVKKKGN